MYNFSSGQIKDFTSVLQHMIGKNCLEYRIERCGELKGRVFASDDFTFIDFDVTRLKIDRDPNCFRNKIYYAKNYKEEVLGAVIEYLDSSPESIISVTGGSTYFFHQNQVRKTIFNPKTWLRYEHHITDSSDEIIFSETYQLGRCLSGTIQTNNDKLILVMLIGLSILDERMRTYRENSG